MTVISEPTPLYAENRLFHSGRGGAGNYHILKETSLPQPPNTINPPQQAQRSFFGGRGGAGNVHAPGERTIFSFDEELERDRLFHEHHAPVYSVGRGGAGNMVPSDAISTRSHYSQHSSSSVGSSAAHSERSTFSTKRLSSGADKVLGKLTHAIST